MRNVRPDASRVVLIGYGPVASYKYIRFILQAINDKQVESYCVVDLKSRQRAIDFELSSVEVPPEESLYLDDSEAQGDRTTVSKSFARWLDAYIYKHGSKVKVFISTEPQSHEAYLRHCINAGVDTITTKPLVLPMKDGYFDIQQLFDKTKQLALLTKKGGRHAVLCLGRHHTIYDVKVRQNILSVMSSANVPITSLHLKTAFRCLEPAT